MNLPRTWTQGEIGAVAEINARSLSASTHPRSEFLYLDIAAVDKGRISYPEESISFAQAPSRARRLVRNGDVLLSVVRPHLEGIAHIKGNADRLVVSTGFAVLSPTKIDSGFLFQSLFSHKIRSQIAKLLVGSGYPAINTSDVEELVIAFPKSPGEQHRIAKILSTWDEAVEKIDALIEAKESRKNGLMQQLLTARRRVDKFGAEQWKEVQLSKLLRRTFRPIDWSPETPLFLVSLRRRFGGLFRRPTVTGADYKTQDLHELKAGDFLISKRQVVHGAWALVTPGFERSHVSKEYAILVNIAPDQMDMSFFAWLARMPSMIRLARVSSTGVHIEKLIFDPEVFLKNYIRIPSTLAEQNWIASTLDASEAEICLLKHERSRLVRQKRGLMQRLLTGRIRAKAA